MTFSKVKHVLNLFIAALRYRFGIKPDFAQLTGSVPAFDFPNPSSVLESNLQQVWDPAKFQSDPTKLLPQLLDQLIALGKTAQQLRHTLGGNGHRPEKISEVIKQLTEGGDEARNTNEQSAAMPSKRQRIKKEAKINVHVERCPGNPQAAFSLASILFKIERSATCDACDTVLVWLLQGCRQWISASQIDVTNRINANGSFSIERTLLFADAAADA